MNITVNSTKTKKVKYDELKSGDLFNWLDDYSKSIIFKTHTGRTYLNSGLHIEDEFDKEEVPYVILLDHELIIKGEL